MRDIAPGLVWIGNARDTRDVSNVLAKEIQAVVDLAIEEPPVSYPRDILYCRFPMIDGAGNQFGMLRTAIQTLNALIQNKFPTLVFCSGGMSRSVAVTAVALSNSNGGTPKEWLTRIAAAGPHDVAPAFWNEILQTAGKYS